MFNSAVDVFSLSVILLAPLHWFLVRFSTRYLVRWCRMKRHWQRVFQPPFEVEYSSRPHHRVHSA